jgi:hypothetical protein
LAAGEGPRRRTRHPADGGGRVAPHPWPGRRHLPPHAATAQLANPRGGGAPNSLRRVLVAAVVSLPVV